MSQTEILAILSLDIPMTQTEIMAELNQPFLGNIGNCLAGLKKKGLIKVVTLDRPYRPKGYLRVPGDKQRGGLPKLSEEQRAEIVRRGKEGEFCSILAREYGISADCASELVNREKRA